MLAIAGCATAPTEYHAPAALGAGERAALNLRVFERAWELVDEKYFDAQFRGVDWPAMREKHRPEAVAAQDDEALYQALNRLAAELKESHLRAISPRRDHERSAGQRAAVGMRWQMLEGRRVIADVVPGGAAAIAGVQRGWFVLTRNGTPLREGDPYVPKLGEPVTYGFLDENETPRTLTMEPRLISFARQEEQGLPGGFIYLRFDEFSRENLSWLSGRLKAHSAAPGVVIDLRENHGGNALALNVAVAEFFSKRVAEGRLIRRGGREREANSLSWRSARYAGRVAILTGPVTGSAAEIFAHVLQHHRRAVVIGRRTAGAVIYSRYYPLPGGGRLQIPVSDYLGLDGKRLEGRGVAPDIAVPAATAADFRANRDADLAAALQELTRSQNPSAD